MLKTSRLPFKFYGLIAFVVVLTILISAIATEKKVYQQIKTLMLSKFKNDVIIIQHKIKNVGDNLSKKASLVGELPIMAYVVEDGDVPTIKDSSRAYLKQLELDVIDIYDIESEFLSHVDKAELSLNRSDLEELAIEMYGEPAGYRVLEYSGITSILSYAIIGNKNDPVGTIFMLKYLNAESLLNWKGELFSETTILKERPDGSFGKKLKRSEIFKNEENDLKIELFESDHEFNLFLPIFDSNKKQISTFRLTINKKNLNEQLWEVRLGLLLSGFVILVVALFIAYIFSTNTVKDLSRATHFAKALNDGKLNEEIHTDRIDEVGELIKALDQMRHSLASNINQLDDDLKLKSSEILKQNEELKVANEKALAGAHAKSEFLATMSHEIRTPMNGVIGIVDLLKDSELTAEQKDLVGTIKSSGEALLTIINDILDFSKIEAGQLKIDEVTFDSRQTFQDIIVLFRSTVDQKGIELKLEVDDSMPDMIIGDPGRLRQILTNLIGNAIKFTRRGNVTMMARAEKMEEDKFKLYFNIKDTGIGIPKDKFDSLFKEFSQVDMSTSRKYGGTGLGLVICKRLVNMMKGELAVKSEENKGSEFYFDIIVREGNGLEYSEISEIKAPSKVLMIEPKWRGAEAILAGLNREIGNVELAEDFDDLKSKLMSTKETCLVCLEKNESLGQDLMMLGKFWNEFRDNHICLVYVSRGARGEVQLSKKLGFTAYLTDPYDDEQFDELCEILMSRTKIADHLFLTKYDLIREAPTKVEHTFKVLLAEDNNINRKVLTKMLNKCDVSFEIAKNGKEAVELFRKDDFQLIFMDMQMPKMDGLEATVLIRKEQSWHIPIIALTANAMAEDKQNCEKAGMDGFLTKPIQLKTIQDTIAEHRKTKNQ